MAAILFAQLSGAALVVPLRHASPRMMADAMYGGARVVAGIEAEQLGLRPTTRAEKNAAASVLGALIGASACALAGAGVSEASTDQTLSMLNSAGLFTEDVLFTDLLLQGIDAGNVAGYAVLMLAVTILLVKPDAWAYATHLAAEEVEACLIDDSEGPICGPAQMLEDMVCVEQSNGGDLHWVCA